jgi:hypothetical protein
MTMLTLVSRWVSSVGKTVNQGIWVRFQESQFILVVIDHEILSMVIHTICLPWQVQKQSVPCESESCNTSKLLDSLPRNDAVAELCSCEFRLAYCRDPEIKLPQPPLPVNIPANS